MQSDSTGVDPGAATAESSPAPRVTEILRAEAAAYIGYTLLIGTGVLTVWCVPLGFLLMWVGSRGILRRAAGDAGLVSVTKGWVAGAYAVALATLLGTLVWGVVTAIEAARLGEEVAVVGFVAATLLAGAGLAPLALAPFASAAGTRGWGAPVVRAIDMAGSANMLPFAGLCAIVAAALIIPIPVTAMGLAWMLFQDLNVGVVLGVTLALVVWAAAVPLSAVVLTLRYRALLTRSSAPSRIDVALRPILVALGVGLVALIASAVVAALAPDHSGHLEPLARLVARTTPLTLSALGVAAIFFVGAIWWIGRVGASLRLLSRPPHRFEGRLRAVDEDGVVFAPDDGFAAVRVSSTQIERGSDSARRLAPEQRATLLSAEPLRGGEGYRSQEERCPREAILVAGGTREEALSRHLARARRLSFRVAVVGLIGLAFSAVSMLFSVWS